MPLQPSRTAWLAIAHILQAKSNAMALAGKPQRAVHLSLAAAILEQEAPPATDRTRKQLKAAAKATKAARPGADAAYREQLGVAPGAPIPATVGTAHSAGAARGGRGASTKGRGTNK